MKVCFLIDDYSATGGIQRVLPIVASKLSEKIDIDVVSMYNIYDNNNSNLYSSNVTMTTLIQGPKLYIKQCFKIAGLLRKYLNKNNVDILVATSEMLSPYCFLATVLSSTRFCVWTHCPAALNSEAAVQGIFKWLGVKTADCTIALTPETEKKLKIIYHSRKVTNIPNPIDPKLIKEVHYNANSKKIISVGRLSKQKNFGCLVEVAKLVLKDNPDWCWDIYGDGELREEIERSIINNGLEGSLNLMGNRANIYEIYSNYSFLVMTSIYEGFPMVLLEAIANGLPMVSFDIETGPNLLIESGVNGQLIDPFDVEKMAVAINVLINSQSDREKMSISSVSKIADFDIDTVSSKWIELFNSLV